MARRPGKLKRETLRALGSMMKRGSDKSAMQLARLAHQVHPNLTITHEPDLGVFRVSENDASIHVARRTRLHTQIVGLARRRRHLSIDYMIDENLVRPGDLVIDCGSNIGEVSMLCATLGADVIAFEPDPTEFRALQANAEATGRITAHRIALWNETGSLSFFTKNDTGDSSLIDQEDGATPIEVDARRLDDLSDILPQDRAIRLLKLEAEGAEPEIIEGAKTTLARTDYVSVDMGPERGAAQATTVPQVVDALYALGFHLKAFRPNRYIGLFEAGRLKTKGNQNGPA